MGLPSPGHHELQESGVKPEVGGVQFPLLSAATGRSFIFGSFSIVPSRDIPRPPLPQTGGGTFSRGRPRDLASVLQWKKGAPYVLGNAGSTPAAGSILPTSPMQYRIQPEQAFSCAAREGNGKCGLTVQKRSHGAGSVLGQNRRRAAAPNFRAGPFVFHLPCPGGFSCRFSAWALFRNRPAVSLLQT